MYGVQFKMQDTDMSVCDTSLQDQTKKVEMIPIMCEGNSQQYDEEKNNSWKPHALIYFSQFLSSWGDRMWLFAGGLFLIEITPDSFRLLAIYEAALALTVIVFGAFVGRWLDRTPRIIAAQISLFVQNLMVCLCTGLLCLLLSYKEFFQTSLDGWALPLAESAVIFMACIAQIGTLGIQLAIEKDWIVVICGKDDNLLSKMNGFLRTIDLTTAMMAPVLVGFVMAGSGMVSGGILIAIWNVSSFFLEYGTLHYLHNSFSGLRKKKTLKEGENPKKENIIKKLRNAIAVWKHYFSHKVRDAGMALAVLFMTVLAFDNYTRAYIFNAGVTKGIIGILTACASFTGILGSISFPILRKKLGVKRTGLIGFGSQNAFIILCVMAVFAPGTLFRPSALWNPEPSLESVQLQRFTQENSSIEDSPLNTDLFDNITIDSFLIEGNAFGNSSVEVLNGNVTPSDRYMSASVTLLLSGIILSRFGLWIADLSVTQILQEEVDETERGAINGVQYSLNQSFNLFRNILLIILPSIETYGYLIIMSFICVMVGFLLFLSYARKYSKQIVYEVELLGPENKMCDIPL